MTTILNSAHHFFSFQSLLISFRIRGEAWTFRCLMHFCIASAKNAAAGFHIFTICQTFLYIQLVLDGPWLSLKVFELLETGLLDWTVPRLNWVRRPLSDILRNGFGNFSLVNIDIRSSGFWGACVLRIVRRLLYLMLIYVIHEMLIGWREGNCLGGTQLWLAL